MLGIVITIAGFWIDYKIIQHMRHQEPEEAPHEKRVTIKSYTRRVAA